MNGYLYPKENIIVLSQIVQQVVSKGKLSPVARNVASIGRGAAKNLMVQESVEGYALLLENVLRLPSEVAPPKSIAEIPLKLKEEWQWHLFEAVSNLKNLSTTLRSGIFLDNFEKQWNQSQRGKVLPITAADNSFIYSIWEEEKQIEIANSRKRREEEEVMDGGKIYYIYVPLRILIEQAIVSPLFNVVHLSKIQSLKFDSVKG